jgi:REP element-mobilizing transposase RayT
MAKRNIIFVQGEFFHIYNRGNSKQAIFLDEEDYLRFIKLLYLCNSNYSINFRNDIVKKHIDAFDFERGEALLNIGAYVLMPNHFHIYLSPKPCLGPDGIDNVAKFMLKVCTSYSKYFNKKYERSGKLFEDKFKSVHVIKENQAKYLFSYIHLNPVKLIEKDWKESGIKNIKEAILFLKNYRWSSFGYYNGIERKDNKILNTNDFLNYFPDKKSFLEDIFNWLKFSSEE